MSETDLIIQTINAKIETVNKTIASASVVTAQSIEKLEKTIREHNGRLAEVEAKVVKATPAFRTMIWAKEHWYICLIILMLAIMIRIPITEMIGIKTLAATLVNNM